MTTSDSDPSENSFHTKETYDVEESFPMLMATCVKHLREALNACVTEAGHNVTSEQWMILTHLANGDGVTQQDLANRYDRTKVSTLGLLKKLEKSGLVIRRKDPEDGRCNLVYLTVEGRKLQKALIPLAKANTTRLSQGLSPEDIAHLKSTLRKITATAKYYR